MNTADRIVALVIAVLSVVLVEGLHYLITPNVLTLQRGVGGVLAEPFP